MNPETLAALAAALAAALEASPADVAHLAVYGSLPEHPADALEEFTEAEVEE
jgi:hypothetical protein